MGAIVVAEVGQNHRGDIEMALEMVAQARAAGADLVKFQKRNPDLAIPEAQKNLPHEWKGQVMPYIEYRRMLEFGESEYAQIDRVARQVGIPWFASVWDMDSLRFMLDWSPPFVKVPSAKLTDWPLLRAVRAASRPSILSTGMSSLLEVRQAVSILQPNYLLHACSAYPAPKEHLNLRCIPALQREFPFVQVGYSGHEVGLSTTIAAVALGAQMVERHVTLDRSLPGTDQAASVEFGGLRRLVRDIRSVEVALGDGIKRVQPSEVPVRVKLRGEVD